MADPYFSELKYLGGASLDFVEVAVDAGTDVSNISVIIYHPSGAVRSTNALVTPTDTVAGTDVYVLDTATSATFTGLHANGAAALVVDGVVTHFYSFGGTLTAKGGPANGLNTTAIGTTGQGESLESTDGVNYTVQSTPTSGTVPCFLRGTMILTAEGEKPVEDVKVGDFVVTQDDGLQPVLWQGGFEVRGGQIDVLQARPIKIRKGSLGRGVPSADLFVSPNHCMMLASSCCELLFAVPEVLVAAKALVDLEGLSVAHGSAEVQYHHLLFERHQIIFANGTPTESLNPAVPSFVAMRARNRRAIETALQSTPDSLPGTVRMKLRRFEAKALVSQLAQADGYALAA